jgi:hypothetical protein
MSINLSNNAVAAFDKQVKHAYQGSSLLRSTVRVKTGVVGSTYKFHKMGQGTATPRVPQTDVIPMNITHTGATATLADWNAPEYTDIFDEQKVSYSERAELAETIANAIGRREDQMIIDALDASGTSNTIADTIGTLDAMNTTKARRAKRFLDANAVPKADRTMLISAIGLEQMLGHTSTVSSDYNTVKALVSGELDTWLGFKWITIDTRDSEEGGLALSTNDRTAFAYHKKAIGLAIGKNRRTEVNYIAEKTSWLANGLFIAGSITIDAEGIVDITYDESVEVASD